MQWLVRRARRADRVDRREPCRLRRRSTRARMGRDLLPYIAEVPQVVNDRTTNWTAGAVAEPRLGAAASTPSSSPRRRSTGSGTRSSTSAGSTPTTRWRAWRERMEAIVASADRLTERRFDAIHLKGPGTDLTIGLLPELDAGSGAEFTTVDGLTPLPEPADRGGLHDPGPRAGRRARVGDDAARVLRVVHGRDPDRVRGRPRRRVDADMGADALRAAIAQGRGRRRGSASSRSSTARAGSARSAPSSTTRCSTRTRRATSRSATPTRSRSRTRPTASASTSATSTSTS